MAARAAASAADRVRMAARIRSSSSSVSTSAGTSSISSRRTRPRRWSASAQGSWPPRASAGATAGPLRTRRPRSDRSVMRAPVRSTRAAGLHVPFELLAEAARCVRRGHAFVSRPGVAAGPPRPLPRCPGDDHVDLPGMMCARPFRRWVEAVLFPMRLSSRSSAWSACQAGSLGSSGLVIILVEFHLVESHDRPGEAARSPSRRAVPRSVPPYGRCPRTSRPVPSSRVAATPETRDGCQDGHEWWVSARHAYSGARRRSGNRNDAALNAPMTCSTGWSVSNDHDGVIGAKERARFSREA